MRQSRTMLGAARAAARRLTQGRSAATALLVPVQGAAALIELCAGSGVDDHGLPPHVTVLHPFVPAGLVDATVHADLSELIGAVAAFPFDLRRIDRFPGNVVYAVPEPAEPFVALTTAIWRRWPDHAPYGGAFPTIVPHLTLLEGPEPPGFQASITPLLPVRAEATEVLLYGPAGGGSWRNLARFPLMQGQV